MALSQTIVAGARAVECRLAAIDTARSGCIAGDSRDRPVGHVHIGVDGQRPRDRVQCATTAADLEVATR